MFVRDRGDRPRDGPSDREPDGPIGHHFSVDVLLENRPDYGLKAFGWVPLAATLCAAARIHMHCTQPLNEQGNTPDEIADVAVILLL